MDEKHPTRLRLEDQRDWLSAKAGRCQQMHKRLHIAEMVCAAAIPFITGWQVEEPHIVGNMAFSAFLAGALGIVVVLLISAQRAGKYQENWINYRQAAEALISEEQLHRVGAGPYAEAGDPDRLLAERVEGILQRENKAWIAHTAKK